MTLQRYLQKRFFCKSEKHVLKKWNFYFYKSPLKTNVKNLYICGMNESTKIKVAVSATLRNQLEMDIQDYGLKGIGDLCNKIIEFRDILPQNPQNKRFSKENNDLFKNCAPLQFTLHKRNHDFEESVNSTRTKLASLCRHYLEQYIDMPRGKRELFLKKLELLKIEKAIEAQKNVWLDYKGQRKLFAPCFIAFSPAQVRAYLVICNSNHQFKALRICHIKNVEDVELQGENSKAFHTQTNALFKKAQDLREHFDPFLCHGQELRVELSTEGVAIYNRAVTNRPKVLKVPAEHSARNNFTDSPDGIKLALESCRPGVYILECSPELAKVYFPQFLETAQIISPPDLRNYFRQRFLKAATAYGLI